MCYAVRGGKEREREGERLLLFKDSVKITNLASHINVTHQGLPSVSITTKSMTYRVTAYLKVKRGTSGG